MVTALHSPGAEPFLDISGTECLGPAGSPGSSGDPKAQTHCAAICSLTLKLHLSGEVELGEEHQEPFPLPQLLCLFLQPGCVRLQLQDGLLQGQLLLLQRVQQLLHGTGGRRGGLKE